MTIKTIKCKECWYLTIIKEKFFNVSIISNYDNLIFYDIIRIFFENSPRLKLCVCFTSTFHFLIYKDSLIIIFTKVKVIFVYPTFSHSDLNKQISEIEIKNKWN